jgi:hypothetical protein
LSVLSISENVAKKLTSDSDKTPDRDGDNDKDALDWKIRLGIATALTEQHDAIDTPVDVLLGILGGVAKTSEAVSGYRKEALPEPGHYRIVQFTKKKPETVDRDYSGKDEKKEPTPLKVGNISEFLRESEFGKILAGKSRKTNKGATRYCHLPDGE